MEKERERNDIYSNHQNIKQNQLKYYYHIIVNSDKSDYSWRLDVKYMYSVPYV